MEMKLVAVVVLMFASTVYSAPPPPEKDTVDHVQSSGASVSSSQEGPHTYTSGFAAATGSDGKTYYVKDTNGHIERGVMEGPLPALDLSGVFANAFPPQFPFYAGPAYNFGYMGPTANSAYHLNSAIRQSVNQYLQNLRI